MAAQELAGPGPTFTPSSQLRRNNHHVQQHLHHPPSSHSSSSSSSSPSSYARSPVSFEWKAPVYTRGRWPGVLDSVTFDKEKRHVQTLLSNYNRTVEPKSKGWKLAALSGEWSAGVHSFEITFGHPQGVFVGLVPASFDGYMCGDRTSLLTHGWALQPEFGLLYHQGACWAHCAPFAVGESIGMVFDFSNPQQGATVEIFRSKKPAYVGFAEAVAAGQAMKGNYDAFINMNKFEVVCAFTNIRVPVRPVVVSLGQKVVITPKTPGRSVPSSPMDRPSSSSSSSSSSPSAPSLTNLLSLSQAFDHPSFAKAGPAANAKKRPPQRNL